MKTTTHSNLEGHTSRRTPVGSTLAKLVVSVLAAVVLLGCAESPAPKAPAGAQNGQDYWKVDGPQRTGNHNPKQTSR